MVKSRAVLVPEKAANAGFGSVYLGVTWVCLPGVPRGRWPPPGAPCSSCCCRPVRRKPSVKGARRTDAFIPPGRTGRPAAAPHRIASIPAAPRTAPLRSTPPPPHTPRPHTPHPAPHPTPHTPRYYTPRHHTPRCTAQRSDIPSPVRTRRTWRLGSR